MRPEAPPGGQLVATAGSAIVAAAKVGRILGRSGWRIARQLPVVAAVERELQRARQITPPSRPAPSPEDERVMMLVQNAHTDPEPLRTAMAELLERSAGADGTRSRDYLFGSIVSQLVPDEARLLATLATGERFAVLDVVAKIGRSTLRPVLSNASTVGMAAGLAEPGSVATYLDRLHGFGLVELAPAGDELSAQFDALLKDPAVVRAKAAADAGRQAAKFVRKTATLTSLGREFWTASAPSRSTRDRRSG